MTGHAGMLDGEAMLKEIEGEEKTNVSTMTTVGSWELNRDSLIQRSTVAARSSEAPHQRKSGSCRSPLLLALAAAAAERGARRAANELHPRARGRGTEFDRLYM